MADTFPRDPAAPGRPPGWVRPASSVYTGTLPDGRQLLLTVWGDGTAEVAMRLKPSDTWSPPEPLTRERS